MSVILSLRLPHICYNNCWMKFRCRYNPLSINCSVSQFSLSVCLTFYRQCKEKLAFEHVRIHLLVFHVNLCGTPILWLESDAWFENFNNGQNFFLLWLFSSGFNELNVNFYPVFYSRSNGLKVYGTFKLIP